MLFKSTKTFNNLPCSHQQWQDSDDSGVFGTGHCAQTHGYSRSVSFEFSCTEVDDYGWVVGFGSLKPVKRWLEFMFDHTSLWEASDPRLSEVIEFNDSLFTPAYNIRVMPTGVSMEQTALFVAMNVNPYILSETGNRCWISRVEVRENDKNSGILEMDLADALKMNEVMSASPDGWMSTKERYSGVPPKVLINQIETVQLHPR